MMNENWALTELPKGWLWTDFESISRELKAGGTPLTKIKKYYDDGNIPFVKIEDIVDSSKYLYDTKTRITEQGLRNSSAWLVPRDSLLYSMYASYGEPIINKIEVATSQAIIAYIPPQGLIVLDYVYYYLKKIRTELTTRGTTQKNLNAQIVKHIPIPLAPFNEQVRIVAKLEELFTSLDAGVEGLRKVKAQLKRYRQAVLKYAYEGKLTEEWRKTHKNQTEPATKLLQQIKQERTEARNHELSPIEESDLPTLSDDWTWTTLNEVSQINMGQSPIGSSYNNSGRGVPLLNGPTEFGEEHPTAVQWTTSPTKICNKDDLLICVRGNTTGRMNWADQQYCIGRGLAAISPLENIVKRELLYYFLLMKVEEIMRRTRGSTFPNLKSDELHRFPFPLAPYIEQEELVERIETAFSTAHRLERNMATALLQSERLRQSILKAAFEGKLVPQDPNDEPAEKLLERIKDEKAKSKGEKDINKKKNKPKQLELSSYVK
jgi:type I restriction enzyme S subunit